MNGVAVPATVPQRSNQGALASIRAAFVGVAFEPIKHQNPSLGVTLCSSSFAVPDDELRTLQKFVAIRRELTQAATPAAPAPSVSAPNPDASSAAPAQP